MASALRDDRHGADHAFGIDAPVRVEILVFRRDEGLLDHLRNGRARQIKTAFMRIFGEDGTVAGVHARRDGRLVVL